VDEVNEKISLVQENCLAIYDSYYCLTEIINAIIYCCDHLNKKLYYKDLNADLNEDFQRFKRASTSTYLSFKLKEEKKNANSINFYDLETDYKKNVVERLEKIKKIASKLMPLNCRLELLENMYSLIYLSINDLKDAEGESDDDDDENDLTLANIQIDSNEKGLFKFFFILLIVMTVIKLLIVFSQLISRWNKHTEKKCTYKFKLHKKTFILCRLFYTFYTFVLKCQNLELR